MILSVSFVISYWEGLLNRRAVDVADMCGPNISDFLFSFKHCVCFYCPVLSICGFVLFLSFHFTLTLTVLCPGALLAFCPLAASQGIYFSISLLPPFVFYVIILDPKSSESFCVVMLKPPHSRTSLPLQITQSQCGYTLTH